MPTVDFDATVKAQASPFQKASAREKRLKLFLWGDSGVGKTTLALRFPKPAVIDLEGGTEHYGESFEFDVLPATTPDEVSQAVDWLLSHEHPYRTLVIDPVTVYWEALQKQWSDIFLRRNQGSKGYKFEFYDLQPRDWQTLKAEFKDLIRRLHALDMNVIVTAREKPAYAETGFMHRVGETFDGEKSLPYLFDTVVRIVRDEKGRRIGRILKDRTNRLPAGEFEIDYAVFEQVFGKKELARKARKPARATDEQKERIRAVAGELGLTDAQVERRLPDYGATTLDELTQENAQIILDRLETARSLQSNGR